MIKTEGDAEQEEEKIPEITQKTNQSPILIEDQSKKKYEEDEESLILDLKEELKENGGNHNKLYFDKDFANKETLDLENEGKE